MGHTASSANRMAYTMKEPIGVVAAISAFNHPFNLSNSSSNSCNCCWLSSYY